MVPTGDGAGRSGRHPRAVAAALALGAALVALVAAEIVLRLFGFGNPILYDSNALYGYRPVPNQRVAPVFGPAIAINDRGLRCDEAWGPDPRGKVLFLGDSVTFGGNVENAELFSQRAVRDLAGVRACNGGVNAWGVENVRGLLVDSGFLPASTYVFVFIEDDFYRGLTRAQGQLVWVRKPRSATLQVLLNGLHVLDEQERYLHWGWFATPEVKARLVDRAVRSLVDVRARLAAAGFASLVYVSPMRDQVVDDAPSDALVAETVRKYGVPTTYLKDEVRAAVVERDARSGLFADNVHLSRAGHEAWGAIIARDLARVVGRAP